jgi:hypothetical protein
MLENLTNLVKEQAGDAIINNPAIPNEQNDNAIQAASGSITEVLQEKVSSGNFGDLSQLFSGSDLANNPIVAKIKDVFAGKLGNMGVDGTAANGAAAGIIPGLIEKFVKRTNDPNDKGFDLQSMLKQFAGPDGKFDMGDVMNIFKGNSGSGGGIGGMLGGMFGKKE